MNRLLNWGDGGDHLVQRKKTFLMKRRRGRKKGISVTWLSLLLRGDPARYLMRRKVSVRQPCMKRRARVVATGKETKEKEHMIHADKKKAAAMSEMSVHQVRKQNVLKR